MAALDCRNHIMGDRKEMKKPDRIDNIDEANRVIGILFRDRQIQYEGKLFWMWTLILTIPFQIIFGDFLKGVWKGLFG